MAVSLRAWVIGAMSLVVSQSAFAEMKKIGKYDLYQIKMETREPVRIYVSKMHLTIDVCNRLELVAKFSKVEASDASEDELENSEEAVSGEFVVDAVVKSKEQWCPAGPMRRVPLRSQSFELEPVDGRVSARVLLPANLELKIE